MRSTGSLFNEGHSMLTRSLLRGCSAFIAFFALCLSATSGGRAQDILKELEQADHEAAKKPAGHNHVGTTQFLPQVTFPRDRYKID